MELIRMEREMHRVRLTAKRPGGSDVSRWIEIDDFDSF